MKLTAASKVDSAGPSLSAAVGLLSSARNQTPVEDPALTPPLKWAGGKRWLVRQVATIWEQHSHKRYVEPFCGGLAMALGLKPGRALLNDINPHLINFYSQVQDGLKVTIEMANDAQLFYAHRDRFNRMIKQGKIQTQPAAQLFYFLNRTCFNGLCRFNQSGEFNVPFGSYKKINYVSVSTNTENSLRLGSLLAGIWKHCRSKEMTSSMQIRRTTWSSRPIARAVSPGKIRCARGVVGCASGSVSFVESGHSANCESL